MRIFLLTIVSIASCFSVFSNENKTEEPNIHTSYPYVDLGLGPLPVPAFTVSAGKRFVGENRFALDTGATLSIQIIKTLQMNY